MAFVSFIGFAAAFRRHTKALNVGRGCGPATAGITLCVPAILVCVQFYIFAVLFIMVVLIVMAIGAAVRGTTVGQTVDENCQR